MLALYMTLLDNEEDKELFEKLYYSQKSKLYNIAFRILKNEHWAEEAVSETFLNVAKSFQKVNSLSSHKIEAYIVITIKNVCRNKKKVETKNDFIEEFENQDEILLSDSDIYSVDDAFLREKIAMMSEADKEMLLLFYFYEFSLKDIAKMKNASVNAIQHRIGYARANLKRLMRGEKFE